MPTQVSRCKEGIKLLIATGFLTLGFLGAAGCDEGPLEEAGEEVDEAADEAEDRLN